MTVANYLWIVAVQLTTTVSGASLGCSDGARDQESFSILCHRELASTGAEYRHGGAEEGLRHARSELTGASIGTAINVPSNRR